MLEEIITQRGQPTRIRCDNGPELTSRHFLAWCVERQVELVQSYGKDGGHAALENASGDSHFPQLRRPLLVTKLSKLVVSSRERKKGAGQYGQHDSGRRAFSLITNSLPLSTTGKGRK